MSSNDQGLKADHPPAVKAGGTPIRQNKHSKYAEAQDSRTPEEKAEEEEFQEPPEKANDAKVIVSGVVTKGNADFKAEAVKVAHDKPEPQHDKRPPSKGSKGTGMVIQQPRKS
jgi:hypothetical protein